MGSFKSQLERDLKNKKIASYTEEKQKEIKVRTLEEIVDNIENKKNRFVFYCPDIAVVNPLVKLVYETALGAQKAGLNVVILHEVNGFKAHWLYESAGYEQYKNLKVEYVINKKQGKKATKTKNLYSFNITDTLIVTDAFQDMLENILAEESLRLIQKVVLVTGYMGLASIKPGMDYDTLNVNSLIFFDEGIKKDYESLFLTKNYLLDNYPISQGFNKDVVKSNLVNPVIMLTSIANNDMAQQLINIFYNKYPNLSMFTFKIIARENMDVYIDNLSEAAAFVILDKNIVTKQAVYEALNIGVPVIVPNRREFTDDQTLSEFIVVDNDLFGMAQKISEFCLYWLDSTNTSIKNMIQNFVESIGLNDRTVGNFESSVADVFLELHNNRKETFTKMINSVNG